MAWKSKRAQTAKAKGRRGGLATARNNTPEFLEQRSLRAGEVTLGRYGSGFYKYIRTLRTKPNKSSKEKVRDVIKSILPTADSVPETPLQLIEEAAKSISNV